MVNMYKEREMHGHAGTCNESLGRSYLIIGFTERRKKTNAIFIVCLL